MNPQNEVMELRNSLNMNRREFSEYYGIPYRTVQDWEAGKRTMPDYVLRLMKYKAKIEKLYQEKPGICKVTDTGSVERLFQDWEESLIWSCPQGVMGAIYVRERDFQKPDSAVAVLGDFCYFVGKTDSELIKYMADKYDFIIMVPQNGEWAAAIETVCGTSAEKSMRYAIKKEPGIFDLNHLEKLVAALPEGYTLQMIDGALYETCKAQSWTKDFVAQFETYEEYADRGLGFMITRGREIVAGASSYSAYIGGIEVEIVTKEEYRRKGLATVCGAKLILECTSRGLYPSWDAANTWSASLAQKLGYRFSHEYVSYKVTKEKEGKVAERGGL